MVKYKLLNGPPTTSPSPPPSHSPLPPSLPPCYSINEASSAWGLECLRYEIRDIAPPFGVKAAMELQAEAERTNLAGIHEEACRRLDEATESLRQVSALVWKLAGW